MLGIVKVSSLLQPVDVATMPMIVRTVELLSMALAYLFA